MNELFIPKYCNANSILLVNQNGILRLLYCPFKVRCINGMQGLKQGIYLWVDEVATNPKDELFYWILGKPYLFCNFEILAIF